MLPLQLNEALLASTHTYTERVYGALSFREADTTTGTFDYTIHVRLTTEHLLSPPKHIFRSSSEHFLCVAYLVTWHDIIPNGVYFYEIIYSHVVDISCLPCKCSYLNIVLRVFFLSPLQTVAIWCAVLALPPPAPPSPSPRQSNYSALHAVPTYLNQMNTAILRLLSGDVEASITTTMHPMPREFYHHVCLVNLRVFALTKNFIGLDLAALLELLRIEQVRLAIPQQEHPSPPNCSPSPLTKQF